MIVDVQGHAGRLRFSHTVISEALYGDLAPLSRRQLHHDAARILQALRSGDLDPHLADIARHSCASLPVGDADEATDYARRAAELAVRQLAYEEGARLFRMALIAHSGSERAGTSERTELLLSLGDAQVKGGDTDSVESDVSRRSRHGPQLRQH